MGSGERKAPQGVQMGVAFPRFGAPLFGYRFRCCDNVNLLVFKYILKQAIKILIVMTQIEDANDII
jgi:hypothetical protein